MFVRTIAAVVLAGMLAGCASAPLPAVYVPPGVDYTGPDDAAPGPGYHWDFNADANAWGWRHPDNGWHEEEEIGAATRLR